MTNETIENTDFDDDDVDSRSSVAFKIFTTEKRVSTHHIDLDDHFDMPSPDYWELLHKLREAKDTDFVNIYLSSYGGDCHVGFQVCHAVKDCRAHTTIIVKQPCYSVGAILACCADRLIMKPGTLLMFHNYSGGSSGKGGEMLMSAKHQDRWVHESFKYFAYPFLTDKEFDILKKDQDVWVHASDKGLKKRMKRHFK